MTGAREIELHRQAKDRFFKQNPHSPLTPQQREKFNGLTYYPYNPDLALTVEVQRFEKPEDVQIQTSDGQTRWYQRWGEFTFTVDGQPARLTIYKTPHGYFLPFADAGAGTETYGAGRYLEPEELPDGRFFVDFNMAYNPFCVYNENYSCPLTPPENRLKVHIRAGERLPQGDWLPH